MNPVAARHLAAANFEPAAALFVTGEDLGDDIVFRDAGAELRIAPCGIGKDLPEPPQNHPELAGCDGHVLSP